MLFLFTVLMSVSHAFEINIDNYQKSNNWYKKPNIMICDDSPVTKDQVEKATAEWKNAGEEIGDIHFEKNNECDKKYHYGYILIMGKRDDIDTNKEYAVTVRWYSRERNHDNSKIIVSSFTEIDINSIHNSSDMHTLLTHELGHSLGYGHHEIKNDIMIKSIMH